jgi:GalNAc-alpha-(1->4)-GalNAc-alpha-(1->3)-diNAcBac-PP-undecaprenol alpha-1,4-N-acetyl-D-galactosaminyltransferase
MIASLAGGGAERVMTQLASHWVRQDRHVTLVTFYPESHDYMRLDARVDRRVVGASTGGGGLRGLAQGLMRVRRLRQEIVGTRPDVVVSFMDRTNILTLLALVGTGIPVVVAERTDPTRQRIGRIASLLRRLTYPRAAAVVVQSGNVLRWAEGVAGRGRARCIPNAVKTDGSEARSRSSGADEAIFDDMERTIVAVGRLSYEKGFDLLVRAFGRVSGPAREWRLMILGEGEERATLLRLAGELGVGDRVLLPGWVPEPARLLESAGLFVLPSRYEGFPNALLEAMACGAPVIAADCPSGPAEIVQHGIDGLLVPPEDDVALAEAMERLISDSVQRGRLGKRARTVSRRFSPARIMALWDDVVRDAAATAGRGS